MTLHPGAYGSSEFWFLITENKLDAGISIRKFSIVEEKEGHPITNKQKALETPIVLDEVKPGFNAFEMVWTRDCTIETYQVKK